MAATIVKKPRKGQKITVSDDMLNESYAVRIMGFRADGTANDDFEIVENEDSPEQAYAKFLKYLPELIAGIESGAIAVWRLWVEKMYDVEIKDWGMEPYMGSTMLYLSSVPGEVTKETMNEKDFVRYKSDYLEVD